MRALRRRQSEKRCAVAGRRDKGSIKRHRTAPAKLRVLTLSAISLLSLACRKIPSDAGGQLAGRSYRLACPRIRLLVIVVKLLYCSSNHQRSVANPLTPTNLQ